MISFIIIARNQAKYLRECFDSILETIQINNISAFEILYIDSDSQDDSIQIAKSYSCITSFIIKYSYNAAIARNIGAKEAKGEILFFIDGDMLLDPSFIPYVFDSNLHIKYDYVSGDLINLYYDEKDKFIHQQYYFGKKIAVDKSEYQAGGIFIIKKELWEKIGGMKDKLRRSQDFDLGLRLAKNGTMLLRKARVIAYHRTIDYRHYSRLAEIIKGGYFLYTGLVYRENIINPYTYMIIFRNEYSMLILLVSLLLSLFLGGGVFICYPACIILRTYIYSRKHKTKYLGTIVFNVVKDIIILFGLLAFNPSQKKEYSYQKIS